MTRFSLVETSITQLAEALAAGEVTAVELLQGTSIASRRMTESLRLTGHGRR